jgi:O-antigen/teichoic acid export membrane protein
MERAGGISSGIGFDKLRRLIFEARSGIRDVFTSMAPQALGLFTGLAASVAIARGLGPAGLGKYAICTSLSGVASCLSDLGIGQTAIRYAARAHSRGDWENQAAVLRWAFRIRILIATCITVLGICVANPLSTRVWHDSNLAPLLRLALVGGFVGTLAGVPSVFFQSCRRFEVNAAISIAQRIAGLAGILAIAVTGTWSVSLVLKVNLLVTIGALTAFLVCVPRQALFQSSEAITFRTVSKPPVPSYLADDDRPASFAFYNLLSTIIVMCTLQADVWIMGNMLSAKDVGLYSAATRFTIPLTMVLTAINTALWPRASVLNRTRADFALITKTFHLCMIVAGAGAVYAIVAPGLAPMLFGARFAGTTLLGQLLCLRYCISILVCPVAVIGYSFGLVRIYTVMNLVQMAAVILFNGALIKRLGPLAPALALILNELIGATWIAAVMWMKLSRNPLKASTTYAGK